MKTLALDVGSSSVKAAVFDGTTCLQGPARAAYATQFSGDRVEIDPAQVLGAIKEAIQALDRASQVDVVGLSVTSPAWVAMDGDGTALTKIVTHQDRRSVTQARQIESVVGHDRHLQLAGNRPFPGGISSTTCAWFAQNEPGVLARADLIGHLSTFLLRQMTGTRVMDPSNASFTGLYATLDMSGWSEELCAAAKCPREKLPEIREADVIGGKIHAGAAAAFGLREGTPMLPGMVDTSAAMMATDAAVGQVFHMCGSTDVLGVVTDKPVPNDRLLTRALGMGRKWMAVSTIAAAGSAIEWMKQQCFEDKGEDEFHQLVDSLGKAMQATTVGFEPYLAGDRMSIEQRQGAFTGLTLSTTREQMLAAVVESIARLSAARVPLLREVGYRLLERVFVSGGGATLADISHRDWPGRWEFVPIVEAGLAGLARVARGI